LYSVAAVVVETSPHIPILHKHDNEFLYFLHSCIFSHTLHTCSYYEDAGCMVNIDRVTNKPIVNSGIQ